MTLADLKIERAELLGDELIGEDLASLREGMVLYGGSLSHDDVRRDDQTVITHGFRYVNSISLLGYVECLGSGLGGQPLLYTYRKTDLETNRFLFRTKPQT